MPALPLPTAPGAGLPARRGMLLVDDGSVHGGGQLSLWRSLQHPSRFDRSVVLFCPNPVADLPGAESVPVTTLQRRAGRAGMLRGGLRFAASGSRGGGADVVVANSLRAAFFVALAPRRGRCRLAYIREDLSPRRRTGLARTALIRLALPRFDGLLVNSAWTATTIPPRLAGKPREVVLPLSGIPADPMPPTAPGGPPDRLRILSLSRVTPWKGAQTLVDATCHLPPAVRARVAVTLAGGIEPRDREFQAGLARQCAEREVEVDWLGHVPDVAPLLARHDVLVVTSVDPEPFGQVIVQGLAAGLVVIGTDQGGGRDVLATSTLGRLVAPGDPRALAAALTRAYEEPPTAAERERSAAEARERFGDGPLAQELDDAIGRLVDRVAHARA